MLSKKMLIEIDGCLSDMERGANIMALRSNYESDVYYSLATDLECARKALPHLIENGEFINEEAETLLNKLFWHSASVMREGGFPFLALHAERLIPDMFFGDL